MISARNLNGSPITRPRTYRCSPCWKMTRSIKRSPAAILSREQPELVAPDRSLRKNCKLTSNDDQGNEVTTEEDILLFSRGQVSASKTNAWYLETPVWEGTGRNYSRKQEPYSRAFMSCGKDTRYWNGRVGHKRREPLVALYIGLRRGVTLVIDLCKGGKIYAHRSDLRPAKRENSPSGLMSFASNPPRYRGGVAR